MKLHPNPKILKLGILYHAGQLRAFFQFDYANSVWGECLELDGWKVNYRVSEELSFAFEFDPFDGI